MGIYYSSYQCIDVKEQCTHKGPFPFTLPPDPDNQGSANIIEPREYLTAIEDKTPEEIKNLMEYTGSLVRMSPEQKGQAMCNVLGGGLHQMCCDPTRTSIMDPESPLHPVRINRDAFGKIDSVMPCKCQSGDEECISRECTGGNYKTRVSEYEYCKMFPKNGSSQNIQQLTSRDMLPDCINNSCPQNIILKKIALQEPSASNDGDTLFATTTPHSGTSQQTLYQTTTFEPQRTIEDDYTRVIKIAVMILIIVWLLFYLAGAKSAKPAQKWIRTWVDVPINW